MTLLWEKKIFSAYRADKSDFTPERGLSHINNVRKSLFFPDTMDRKRPQVAQKRRKHLVDCRTHQDDEKDKGNGETGVGKKPFVVFRGVLRRLVNIEI